MYVKFPKKNKFGKNLFFRSISNFLTFFGNIYETKNFFFFSFVFELLYGGASRKKKICSSIEYVL
jgi:hypothetical protein